MIRISQKLSKWILSGLVAFPLIWLAVNYGGILLLWSIRALVANQLSDDLPTLSPYFAKAAASAVVIVLLGVGFAIGRLKSRPFRPTYLWFFSCAAFLLIQNLFMGYQARDHSFDSDGRTIRYVSIRPNGEPYYAYRPGFDPETGRELRKVTPELARSIEAWEHGAPAQVDPVSEPFFDSITGDPRLWYAGDIEGDTVRFFDGPGFDPETGNPLEPVTPAIAKRFKQLEKLRETQLANRKKDETRRALELEKTEQKAARAEAIRKLLNLAVISGPNDDGKTISITIVPFSENPGEVKHVENLIVSEMRQRKKASEQIIGSVFRKEFFTESLGRELLENGWSYEEMPDRFKHIQSHGFFSMKINYRKAETNREISTADVFASVQWRDSTGLMIKAESLKATGSGFSDSEALSSAIERLVSQLPGIP